MITALERFLLTGSKENRSYPSTIRRNIRICTIISIALNLALFCGKLLAGSLSGSVAIMSDGYNNLADAGTCTAELLGFTVAGLGAGNNHPYGHGRIEWLMGLAASMFILFMGVQTLKSSILAIGNSGRVQVSPPTVLILVVSIAVKGCMYLYNKRVGTRVSSVTMKAKAYDCLSDMASTAVVLLSSLAGHYFGWKIDGWCGIAVSVFILYSGIQALKEAVSPILGASPDPTLIHKINTMRADYPEILEIYELMVHDYGFGRLVLSFHIGVDSAGEADYAKIASDFSARLHSELGCEAAIQVELIEGENTLKEKVLKAAEEVLWAVDNGIAVNQMRVVQNLDCQTVMMEILVPHELVKKEEMVLQLVIEAVNKVDSSYRVHARVKMMTGKKSGRKADKKFGGEKAA